MDGVQGRRDDPSEIAIFRWSKVDGRGDGFER